MKMHEQILAENKVAFGDKLGDIYTILSNELTWLCWLWHEYTELFATESRLDIANNSAPFFFSIVQQNLWESVLLGISRLAGPKDTYRKQNLSLSRLVEMIDRTEVKVDAKARLQQLVDVSFFAKDWRDRHIAHRDLALSLGDRSKPLASATKAQVDVCLSQAGDLLNAVSLSYTQTETAYSFPHGQQGAVDLLYVLRDGLRRRVEADAVVECGEYKPELFNDDLDPV